MIKENLFPILQSVLFQPMKQKANNSLSSKLKFEMLSVAFLIFTGLILSSIVIFSIYFLAKTYLDFLSQFENEYILTFISFAGIALSAFGLLFLVVKKNREKIKKEYGVENLFSLDSSSLIKLSSCFVDGFLESVLFNLKKKRNY